MSREGDLSKKYAEDGPTWKNRRRVIFLIIGFCLILISYITYNGEKYKDSRLMETIAVSAFYLLGSTVGFYVAGAAWTDVNIERAKVRRSKS